MAQRVAFLTLVPKLPWPYKIDGVPALCGQLDCYIAGPASTSISYAVDGT
jgi:hypothetical protein